jgi:tetratricopeptide (TPR) repeat protein
VPALEDALERARTSGDPRAVARAATNLGRAHYRLGRLDAAAVAMEEALRRGEPGTPEVDDARRSLADIHLQHGRLDGAMVLLRGALEAALARGSRDEEARARRGIAHVLGLEGRYAEAARELETADDLLALGGDVRVRAGVLLRMLELDGAAGRLALALHRSELLIDLLQAHALAGPLPEALAVSASLRHAVGQDDEAAGLAHRALMLARSRPASAWQAVLGAVRVLAELDRLAGDEVDVVLAAAAARSDVRRPAAQALALAARLLAVRDPLAAIGHLERSDAVPTATWGLAEVDRSLDAAWTDLALGRRDAALDRIARAEALLPDDRTDGVRLGLLAVRAAAGDTTLPPGLVRSLVDAVAAPLPGRLRQAFSRRRVLAPLLVPDPSGPAID